MRECGYVPRVPANPEDLLDEQKRKAWEEEKRAKVFTYIHPQDPLLNVNLLIFAPISFADAFSRKQVIAVNNVPVYVASLDDLLAMKRVAGRVKDLYDIRILEKIKERREDERK
jgi:hypothetical protein